MTARSAALYLFADEPAVVRGTAGRALVRLNGLVKSTASAPFELVVQRPDGEPQTIELALEPRAGATTHWSRTLPLVEPGTYRAEWRAGDARSNAIELAVLDHPAPRSGLPLTAAVIPALGIRGEPDLLVRLANPSDAVVDRSLAFLRCAALVDGQRLRMRAPTWDGTPDLAPHASTWFLLALDDFEPRPAPGEHTVQIEMAGHSSAAVRVTIPPR